MSDDVVQYSVGEDLGNHLQCRPRAGGPTRRPPGRLARPGRWRPAASSAGNTGAGRTPWCGPAGRSCAPRPRARGPPRGPGSRTARTRSGRSDTGSRRRPRPSGPAGYPCRCGASPCHWPAHVWVEGSRVTCLRWLLTSVLCTLLSAPRQNLYPALGST